MNEKEMHIAELRQNLQQIIEMNKTENLPVICSKLGIRYHSSKSRL